MCRIVCAGIPPFVLTPDHAIGSGPGALDARMPAKPQRRLEADVDADGRIAIRADLRIGVRSALVRNHAEVDRAL